MKFSIWRANEFWQTRERMYGEADSLRVLHVITDLYTGGAEQSLYKMLAAGLADQFENTVFSLMEDSSLTLKIRELGIRVLSAGMRTPVSAPGVLRKLHTEAQELQPDLIQGWMYHGNLAAWVGACMAPGSPAFLWNVRQSLYGLKNEKNLTRHVIRANRFLSSRASAILYNSHLSRSQHEEFGFDGARARVIPNGFDLQHFYPSPERSAEVRASLGIGSEALVVGHVARLHPMKNHRGFLLAAVRLARARNGIHFVLAGRGVDSLATGLTGLIPGDLVSRFHFLGERGDVADLMRAMDVLCLSSLWGEAFPNVLGEAMASAVPCVTTDVGDSAEIVGNTGLVVPPGDSQALADNIGMMLEKSREQRHALGCAARQRIESQFSLPAVIGQYQQLYEGLVSARGAD